MFFLCYALVNFIIVYNVNVFDVFFQVSVALFFYPSLSGVAFDIWYVIVQYYLVYAL